MLCHGPVRAPADARKGKAVIRFELAKDSGHDCVPTDLPVELVDEAKGE